MTDLKHTTDPKTIFHSNSDNTFTIERKQNYDDIIEANKKAYNSVSTKATQNLNEKRRHVAAIPVVVVEQLMKQGIWNNQDRMKQWLNDPDNKYMRTHPGKV